MGLYPHWGRVVDIITQAFDDTPDAGSSDRMARADHRHGTAVDAHSVTQPSQHGAQSHSAHSGTAVDAHSVTQPSQHGAQSHTVGQASAHSDVNVVQPFIVVHMWKRTG